MEKELKKKHHEMIKKIGKLRVEYRNLVEKKQRLEEELEELNRKDCKTKTQ